MTAAAFEARLCPKRLNEIKKTKLFTYTSPAAHKLFVVASWVSYVIVSRLFYLSFVFNLHVVLGNELNFFLSLRPYLTYSSIGLMTQ